MKQTYTKGTAVKSLLMAAGLVGFAGVSTTTFAEMNFNGEFSGNVSATSTYLWRGVSQTSGAAVQGGVNYTDQSGLHGGLWTSNVDFNVVVLQGFPPVVSTFSVSGNELDVILGYSGKASTLSFDVGAIFYNYTLNVDVPGYDPNFEEIYANISQGQFSAQISNSSDYGTYFEVAGTFPVKSWDMTAHFGHYSLKDTVGDDYADYNVTFKKDMKDYEVSFLLGDTDLQGDDFRTIVTVTKNFGM